jgi:hypothetical protein
MKKKNVIRIIVSTVLALLCLALFTTSVFAAPDDVVIIIANPSNTSVILSWLPSVGSTSYVVVYKTNTYPSLPTDGIVAYSGTETMTTISGLNSGVSYFFCVWGFDGALYSANPAQRTITTLLTPIPSGATASQNTVVAIPNVPSNATITANISGFQLQPLYNIISYADNESYGGLGMPLNNLWEVLTIVGIVVLGLLTYIKMKNFFIAYFLVFVLTCFAVALNLAQGYLIPIELIIGVGVWAVERFFQ